MITAFKHPLYHIGSLIIGITDAKTYVLAAHPEMSQSQNSEALSAVSSLDNTHEVWCNASGFFPHYFVNSSEIPVVNLTPCARVGV